MTPASGDGTGHARRAEAAGAPAPSPREVQAEPAGSGILADRIAAAVAEHEQGWQLPRASALARRYEVSAADMNAVIDELIARRLVRRAPDGRLYRAGPAEYLISLEGVPGLGASVDPMGGILTCSSYRASWRQAPEDAASALRIQRGDPVCVLRLTWMLDAVPAAVTTAYLTGQLAPVGDRADWPPTGDARDVLPFAPASTDSDDIRPGRFPHGTPYAAAVQMQPPPPSVARKLRLKPGQAAILVTVVSGNASGTEPTALTIAALRPDLFRIAVETTPAGESLPTAWRLVAGDGGA